MLDTELKSITDKPLTFKMEENLKGRIRNLALAPSYENTLIPLFEAISNAIHSIQERFGEQWVAKGHIRVFVHRNDDDQPISFSIEDNGVGLNEDNFKSFRTYDTGHKLAKGGKGVGHLTWLKVFELVNVQSTYQEKDGKFYERGFNFILDNESPFPEYSFKENPQSKNHITTVHLKCLKDGYNSKCPKKTESVAHKMIAHFLSYLIEPDRPNIIIEDSDSKYDIPQIIIENTRNPKTDEFEIEDVGSFTVNHLLLKKSLVEKTEHTLYLSAHERIVDGHVINNQTGLDNYFEYEDEMLAYVGIISGEFLDSNVTQERNNFDIIKSIYKAITKAAEDRAKIYLEEPINAILIKKAGTVQRVVTNFPRYKYLVKNKGLVNFRGGFVLGT